MNKNNNNVFHTIKLVFGTHSLNIILSEKYPASDPIQITSCLSTTLNEKKKQIILQELNKKAKQLVGSEALLDIFQESTTLFDNLQKVQEIDQNCTKIEEKEFFGRRILYFYMLF